MGAALSNAKWLMFNDIEELKIEFDSVLQQMNLNMAERKQLNETRAALTRDLRNMRSTSIHNAEVLQQTKKTINHNVNDCWKQLDELLKSQQTFAQLTNVQINAIKEQIQEMKDRQVEEIKNKNSTTKQQGKHKKVAFFNHGDK